MTIEEVLDQFGIVKSASITPFGNGRIHETFLVEDSGSSYILQKIGSLFTKTADDICALTAHLVQKNIPTPLLRQARGGSYVVSDGSIAWRLMSFIPGITLEKNPSVVQAREGAAFIARFHDALVDFDRPFAYRIPGYRDTKHDMNRLQNVSHTHTDSSKRALCAPIAHDILQRATKSSSHMATLPLRVCHGDLKLNNLRFDATGEHVAALIDLDTIGRYPLPLELGDMLRSWCRTEAGGVDKELWQIIVETYRAHAPFISQDEWRLIPDGFQEITLALAARYLTDAYEESWFKHDPSYPSLFEQNVARTRMQLALLDDFARSETSFRILHT